MEDQICKQSSDYNAVILRQHCPDAGLIGTTNAKIDACKLLFGHAESFVDDTSVKKLLKDVIFKGRVRAAVVDEDVILQHRLDFTTGMLCFSKHVYKD